MRNLSNNWKTSLRLTGSRASKSGMGMRSRVYFSMTSRSKPNSPLVTSANHTASWLPRISAR
ncbi:hypothetical protein D9M68_944440 [compost metagenome]